MPFGGVTLSFPLILSLIANALLLLFYASKNAENEVNINKVDFWQEKSHEWRKKYYIERDNKDW